MTTGEPTPSSVPFRERLRLMRTKRYTDWWFVVAIGPIAHVLTAAIAEIRWITPNHLTWLSFACKLGACGVIFKGTGRADIAAAALLQLNVILDGMDGSLARYRKMSSHYGALLDKVTDAIGLIAVFSCIGYRVATETGDLRAFALGGIVGVAFLLRCYVFWVVRYCELKAGVSPSIGTKQDTGFTEYTLRERLRYYLVSTGLIVFCGEGDLYLWASVALVTGALYPALAILAAVQGGWAVIILVIRFMAMRSLDRAQAERFRSAPPS